MQVADIHTAARRFFLKSIPDIHIDQPAAPDKRVEAQ
jgi:hypothetical protein